MEYCKKCSKSGNYMYHSAMVGNGDCTGNCLPWKEQAKELHLEFISRMKRQGKGLVSSSSSSSDSDSSSGSSSGLDNLLEKALDDVAKEDGREADESLKVDEPVAEDVPAKDEMLVVKHPRGSYMETLSDDENHVAVAPVRCDAVESRDRSRSPRSINAGPVKLAKPRLPKLSPVSAQVAPQIPLVEGALIGEPIEEPMAEPVQTNDTCRFVSLQTNVRCLTPVEVMYKDLLDLKVGSWETREFESPFNLKDLEMQVDAMLREADCFPSGHQPVSSVFFEQFEPEKPTCLSDADVNALIRGDVSHFKRTPVEPISLD